jgi:phosphate/sulfate permease
MSNEDTTNLLISVTSRLFTALAILFAFGLAIAILMTTSQYVVLGVVITSGLIGGFIGLQHRLKDLTIFDLQLIANSWFYTCLSPLVGRILALLLYMIFLSGLLKGDLFPEFTADLSQRPEIGFASIFQQRGVSHEAYAKLIFWCFVAGFSERFVTDVISRFEGAAVKTLPQSENILQAAQQIAPADLQKRVDP